MSHKSKRRQYTLLFIATLIPTVALLLIKPEWFWVPLPFALTYFVYMLDVV